MLLPYYFIRVRKTFVALLPPILKVANKERLICRNPIKLDINVPHSAILTQGTQHSNTKVAQDIITQVMLSALLPLNSHRPVISFVDKIHPSCYPVHCCFFGSPT